MKGREGRIQQKLSVLKPQFLEIIDQSELHAKHYKGDKTEATHIKLKIKSHELEKLKLTEGHRVINSLLEDEFENGLHALSITIIN